MISGSFASPPFSTLHLTHWPRCGGGTGWQNPARQAAQDRNVRSTSRPAAIDQTRPEQNGVVKLASPCPLLPPSTIWIQHHIIPSPPLPRYLADSAAKPPFGSWHGLLTCNLCLVVITIHHPGCVVSDFRAPHPTTTVARPQPTHCITRTRSTPIAQKTSTTFPLHTLRPTHR